MSIPSISNERLLLHEITHRINNEFASAIQVVSFTAARSSDGNVKAAVCIENLNPDVMMMKSAEYRA